MASAVEKLHEYGLWIGPNAYLSKKLRYAYQVLGSKNFMGVFEKGTFDEYKQFNTGKNIMYLGGASDLFQPVPGRDRIRVGSELKVLGSDLKFEGVPTEVIAAVQSSPVVLTAYHLDHQRQVGLFEPSSFEGYDIKLSGAGNLGSAIALQLMKLGLSKLSVYDPTEVSKGDPAVSIFRTYDPNRSRIGSTYELIADGSLQSIDSHSRYLSKEDELGQIVINTFADKKIRKDVLGLVRSSGKVRLLLDVQQSGSKGRIFAVNPLDKESVSLYEADIAKSQPNEQAVIDVVLMIASWAVWHIKKYVLSPGSGQASCLKPIYIVDPDSSYRSVSS